MTGAKSRLIPDRAAAIALLLLSLALLAPGRSLSAGRVVATGLCADQMALALLDQARIAGLSRWSRDPSVSAVVKMTGDSPALDGSAETILTSGADTVLMDSSADRNTLRLLAKLGIRVVTVPAAADYAEMFRAIEDDARALGEEERGKRLAGDLRRRLDRLPTDEERPVAAYLRVDGGTAGEGTPVHAALAAAGFDDYAAARGMRGWSSFSLESLVLDPPRILVTSFFDADDPSLSARFSRHPVIRRLLARTPVIALPAPLWSCGGWPLVEAAETLATARAGLRAGPSR